MLLPLLEAVVQAGDLQIDAFDAVRCGAHIGGFNGAVPIRLIR
jgi:hypothetical protein